jgi:DNA-binding protein YbaB
MNNFLSILKQAQDLKSKMSDLKYKLEKTQFDGKDESGKVEVIITGKGSLLDINISSEFSESPSSLKEKIKEAYNNAKILADDFSQSEIKKVTGDLPLPFDLKSFF